MSQALPVQVTADCAAFVGGSLVAAQYGGATGAHLSGATERQDVTSGVPPCPGTARIW
jgi:hypothetical protein